MRDTVSDTMETMSLPASAQLFAGLDRTSDLLELSTTLRSNAQSLREEAEVLRQQARLIRNRR